MTENKEGEAHLFIASAARLVREGLDLSLRGRSGVMIQAVLDLSPPSIGKMAEIDPDVVLIDVSGPEGLQRAPEIRQACPQAKLVAFAVVEIDEDIFACAAAGFCGYAPRDAGAGEVLQAVLDARDGKMRCPPHISAAMFDRLSRLIRQQGPTGTLPRLTSRESEVLALAEEGWSNKEIARRLGISNATVKNHMHNILQKLQVSRRGQATARLRSQRIHL